MSNDKRQALIEKHAAELAEFDRAESMRDNLPESVRTLLGAPQVTPFDKGRETWLSWRVTHAGMLTSLPAMSTVFPALACEARESGCLSIMPEALQSKAYASGKLRWHCEPCYELRCERGEGFTNVEVSWHALYEGKHVRIRLGYEYHQVPQWLTPVLRIERDKHGHKIRTHKEDAPGVSSYAQRVSWGGGGDSSAAFSYYFEDAEVLLDVIKADV